MPKLYEICEVVKNTDWLLFKGRCDKELAKQNLTATGISHEIPILGSRNGTRRTYLSRLRMFVKWLMKYPEFDSSLIMFYPYTPRGYCVVDAAATVAFMFCMTTKKDVVVMNPTVSEIA